MPLSFKNPTAVGFGVGKSFLIADCSLHSITSPLDVERRVLGPNRQRRVAFLKGDWSLAKCQHRPRQSLRTFPILAYN
jgi:hypothetical protein